MTTILLVDLTVLLDTSKVGIEATKLLAQEWESAKKLAVDKQPPEFAKIQAKRDVLRSSLLARAKPIVAELAKERKADLVLDKSAVLWGEATEITSQLIAKVDALGTLKI